MRHFLVLALMFIISRLGSAQEPSAPNDEHWKVVFKTERPQGLQRPVYTLAFSPDGKLLAGCLSGDPENHWGGEIRIWDAATGREQPAPVDKRPRTPKHAPMIASLLFSPDGRLFALGGQVGLNQPTLLWEVATGKQFPALEGTDFSIRHVAFSRDGKLIAICGLRGFSNPRGHRVRVFDASTSKERFEVACDVLHSRLIGFLPRCNTLVTPGPGKFLSYRDPVTGIERAKSPEIEGHTFALALSGKSVLSAQSGKLALIDLQSGRLQARLTGGGEAKFTHLSADGSILLVPAGTETHSEEGATFTLWELSTGKKLLHFRDVWTARTDTIRSVALSADGQKMAIGSDEGLSEWIREQGKLEK